MITLKEYEEKEHQFQNKTLELEMENNNLLDKIEEAKNLLNDEEEKKIQSQKNNLLDPKNKVIDNAKVINELQNFIQCKIDLFENNNKLIEAINNDWKLHQQNYEIIRNVDLAKDNIKLLNQLEDEYIEVKKLFETFNKYELNKIDFVNFTKNNVRSNLLKELMFQTKLYVHGHTSNDNEVIDIDLLKIYIEASKLQFEKFINENVIE